MYFFIVAKKIRFQLPFYKSFRLDAQPALVKLDATEHRSGRQMGVFEHCIATF